MGSPEGATESPPEIFPTSLQDLGFLVASTTWG